MRTLIANVEESYFRSVQFTLDAHGIRHVDSIAHCSESVLKYENCITVDDEDFADARAAIQELQRSRVADWTPRSIRIAALLSLIVIALFVVAWMVQG